MKDNRKEQERCHPLRDYYSIQKHVLIVYLLTAGLPQTPASELEHPPMEAVLTNEPPPPPPPKEILRTVDLTPYIR